MREPGYGSYQDPRLQPMDESDTDALETLCLCRHRDACERLYRRYVDYGDYQGWTEDMARRLQCDACGEFEEE